MSTTTAGATALAPAADPGYRYCVYGIQVSSDIPLGLPDYSHEGLGQVACQTAPASVFEAALQGARFRSRPGSWYRYAFLDDGSSYVRWDNVGEFLVSADGRRIVCRRDEQSSAESFQVYLLGQALSFALVKQHLEPLHATTVVIEGRAVAFLGSNAFGKSSLAASFLSAGFQLLTDDLLVLHESSGGIVAYPGPPRIKLFSKVASRLLGYAGDAPLMNTDTDKRIIWLEDRRSCARPVALRTIYSVTAPRDVRRTEGVRIENLSPRAALIALVGGTFNRRLVNADRLERQFGMMATVANSVPVKTLAYPRAIDRLADVREMVLADLQ